MPIGAGGRYDDESRALLVMTHAKACVILVHEGDEGHGFSVAIDTDRQDPKDFIRKLPSLLRVLADSIEKEIPRTGN